MIKSRRGMKMFGKSRKQHERTHQTLCICEEKSCKDLNSQYVRHIYQTVKLPLFWTDFGPIHVCVCRPMIISNTGLQSHRSCLSLTHTLCHSVLAKHTIYLDLNSYTHLTLNPTLLHLVSFFFFFPPKDSPFNLICSPSAALLRPAPVNPPVFMNFEVVFFFFKDEQPRRKQTEVFGEKSTYMISCIYHCC